ncbi:MAG: hypothetical protein LUG57_08955 [Oscillospiraceae bacterium]|nr:hypothetical protein [Oscillospiraceae bacterium]
MERRVAKVNFSAAGGTAGGNAKTCKITLPNSWLRALGIDEAHPRMEIDFDGAQICLVPYLDFDSFAEAKAELGHQLYTLRFYDAEQLCSTILADFTERTVRVCNEDVALIKTAFGKNEMPSWADFERFLEERCVPRSRAGLREYLEAIGVSEYDPMAIIRKTKGRMAEDQQWLEVEAMP